MRIVLIGQAAFGAKVFETLLENGEDILAVYTPPDGPGGRIDPLKEAAANKGLPVFQPATYKDDAVYSAYKALSPELSVMAFVTDIIPERFFSCPTMGTINYHPSLLPRHRGASAINWAVIMGDADTGLSIFWPDGGIDTGPILLQKTIPIGPDDTTGSLYFNHLFPLGVDAIVESIESIKKGKAPKIPQDEARATYEPPCDDAVAAIDWHDPAESVYNLIRGCDPQPGAYAVYKGEKLRCYGPTLVRESAGRSAGTVLAVDGRGMHIALSGGVLTVAKVKHGMGKKVTGSEFSTVNGIQAGESLAGD